LFFLLSWQLPSHHSLSLTPELATYLSHVHLQPTLLKPKACVHQVSYKDSIFSKLQDVSTKCLTNSPFFLKHKTGAHERIKEICCTSRCQENSLTWSPSNLSCKAMCQFYLNDLLSFKTTPHAFTLECGHKNVKLILNELKLVYHNISKICDLKKSLTHPINLPNLKCSNYLTD
jgi:hypothetical protein